MQDNFDRALKLVLAHEGGWADHPSDPGGATMKGVTLATFRSYYGHARTKEDLRNINDNQLAHIYKNGYWDACRCDDLPLGVDYAVFDGAVNSGPSRSSRWLQEVVGVTVDGKIGPQTLGAVNARDAAIIINQMLDERLAFMQSLSTWSVFGRGWSARVKGVREAALAMGESCEEALAKSFIAWLRENKDLIAKLK